MKKDDYVEIATTRPETMLGDTADRSTIRMMSAIKSIVGKNANAAAG